MLTVLELQLLLLALKLFTFHALYRVAMASCTPVQELLKVGEQLGLQGEDLRAFITEQQQKEREERKEERERREKEREMERLKLEKEIKQMELHATVGESTNTSQGETPGAMDENGDPFPHRVFFNESRFKDPKITPFREGDEMDSFLYRFERFAELQGWPKTFWATYLAGVLSGKALDVYARLTPEQSKDYDTLKTALLKRYALTEEGYKQKFYGCKPEPGETPPKFIVRLRNYFLRWVELADIKQTFDGLQTLLVREQYLSTCPKSLEVFLKEREIKDLFELGQVAERHEDAHRILPTVKSDRKPYSPKRSPRRQWHNKTSVSTGSNANQSKPKCFFCGKLGHIAKNCFKKIEQANAMMARSEPYEYGSGDEQPEAALAMNFRSMEREQGQRFGIKPTGQQNHQSFVPQYGRIQGRPSFGTDLGSYPRPPQNFTSSNERQFVEQSSWPCRKHNRVACTECLNPNVNQHSCGAMIEPEAMLSCGCVVPLIAEACSFGRTHGAKMPVAVGTLFDKPIKVLRDTGCSTVVVRKSLVPDDCLTGETVLCGLIDGTLRQNPVARIIVDTPYLKGVVKATCMLNPLYDLIVGNVPEAEDLTWSCKGHSAEQVNITDVLSEAIAKSDDSTEKTCDEAQAVVTRSQAKSEQKVKSLKVTQSIDCDLSPGELCRLQREDETLKGWFEKAESESTEAGEQETRFEVKDGLLWRVREDQKRQVKQLALPRPLREKVMSLGHDSIMSGHQGVKKTYDRITTEFFWPGVHADVQRYCRSCDICQRTTPKGRTSKVPLGQMPLIDRPFKRVAVDLIGPIAPTTDRGNRYILTMVDYATCYPEASALKSIETEAVAEALVTMFTRVGVTEEVLSDQGTQFMSGVMKEVGRLLSISQLHSTVYHPMCNGLVERFNGTLKAMLRRMCSEKPKDWDRYLAALLFAYREVPQESLNFSPFELLYGRSVRGPMSILKEIWTKQSADPDVKLTYQYVLELQNRLQETCELARQELSKAQTKQKRYYDVKKQRQSIRARRQSANIVAHRREQVIDALEGSV